MVSTTVPQGQQPKNIKQVNNNVINNPLYWLYIGTTFLCCFMVLTIVTIPSTGFQGLHPAWDALRTQLLERQYHTPVSLVPKMARQWAVHFTHTFPSVVWALLIPWQLHPQARRVYPHWHRRLGYVFVACAVSMAVGVVIIFQRGLYFGHIPDDHGEPNHDNDPAWIVELSDWLVPPTEWLVKGLGVWFVSTLAMAVRQARCARRSYHSHRRWMIRHVASGLWVSLLRVFSLLIKPAFTRPQSTLVRNLVFAGTGQCGVLVALLAGEYAIHCCDGPTTTATNNNNNTSQSSAPTATATATTTASATSKSKLA